MIKNILFYYCLIISLFISISGILGSRDNQELLFQLIFLPITIYFLYIFSSKLIDKKEKIPEVKLKPYSFFLIMIFLTISILNLYKNFKNVPKKNKINKTIILFPSPKKEKLTSVILKKEFENDTVNIRSSPSKQGKIIDKMEKNKKYLFLEKNNDWYKIKIDDKKIGYVNSFYTEIIK